MTAGVKRTQEQFVRELRGEHPELEVLGVYKNAQTKISVRCKNCGFERSATPQSLLRSRYGCPKCSADAISASRRLSHEEFVSRFRAKHGEKVQFVTQYSTYESSIIVRCADCGHRWTTTPDNLMKAPGCPKCSKHHVRSELDFLEDLRRVNPNVELLGAYVNMGTKTLVKCKRCDHKWRPTPTSLLRGTGCPKCAGNAGKSQEEFVKEVAEKNPAIEVVGRYVRSNIKIEVRCRACGNAWKATPNNLLNGSGCPECARKKKKSIGRLSNEEFVQRLAEANPSIEPLAKYNGIGRKLAIKCKVCGHEWHAVPGALLKGHGCPRCAAVSTSIMEQCILLGLKRALGDGLVLHRDRSAIEKELDILVPLKRLAVEPGSWYWHKDKLAADKAKRSLCAAKGIRLVTIYDSFDGAEPPFDSDCWTFAQNLGSEEGHPTLKTIVERLLQEMGITTGVDNQTWIDIESLAAKRARRRDTESFREELAMINPSIEVIGEYRGGKERIEVRCRNCGNTWSPKASELLAGNGCRKCGRKTVASRQRKSHDEFASEVSRLHPDLVIVGRYTTSSKPVSVHCNACGNDWIVRPANLLRGSGCPTCSSKRRAARRRKTPEQFQEEFSRKGNPDVILLGKYQTRYSRIKAKCKKCGRKWNPTAAELLNGRGCPKCSGRMRKTHDEFIREVTAKAPSLEVKSQYINASTPVLMRCKDCGHTWQTKPPSIVNSGHGCPKCSMKKAGRKNALSQEEFARRMSLRLPGLEVTGKYLSGDSLVSAHCHACGYEWNATAKSLLHGIRRCPRCRASLTKVSTCEPLT